MKEPEDNYGFWLRFPPEVKRLLISRRVIYRNRKWEEIIDEMRECGAEKIELRLLNQGRKSAMRKLKLDAQFAKRQLWSMRFRNNYQRNILES